jgi:hypothetical protein
MTRLISWLLVALGFLAFGLLPAKAQGRASRCSGSLAEDRIITVNDDASFVLAKGQMAKILGLRLPEEESHRRQAADLLRVHRGKTISVEGIGERDRWGRLPVRIRSAHDKTVVDLSHVLVETGLTLVDPGADRVFCQPELLAFEETAREQRLGLWAEARYNPIPAEKNELLRERVGSFVIVEGRVRSVGERKQTTYLNFGGHWAEDFTIIIPRKVWTLMAERGLGAAALKGQRIRARGILQSWQGTALTIELPEMIERLEGNRLPR